VDEEIRFYIERAGNVAGPVADDEIREALRSERLEPGTRVRLAGSDLWVAPQVFATFARSRAPSGSPPASPSSLTRELPLGLASASPALLDLLLFWVSEGGQTFGPLTGEQIRQGYAAARYRKAAVCLLESEAWYAIALLFGRDPARATTPGATAIYLGAAAGPSPSLAPISQVSQVSQASPAARAVSVPSELSVATTTACPVCLERIPAGRDICPECQEPVNALSPASIRGPNSIPDDLPGTSWLGMHWRPVVTLGVMATLITTGITLRYLAPGRFLPPRAAVKPAASALAPPAACATACWTGEACTEGKCVWQKPNDVRHVASTAEPTVGGPFALPKDVSDALPLDDERFAVALLGGMQVHNTRTGGVLSLVSDAPQSRRLYRVGKVIYATAPTRIYVVDAGTTRLLKTIELGAQVGEVTLGATGRRALASLPGAHAVAVLATEYHAEIDRIPFGDDSVGPIGADETGKRALTTTGQVPLPGLRDPQGGAVYAFDPSRLASAQDRVRASMVGNPVSVLMSPDGESSYVVLRAEDSVIPLEWLPSGAVRRLDRIPTCREPEQMELVRRDRLGVVRCNEGQSIEIVDLQKREVLRRIPFNARVADMAISPDGEQAIVALPAEGNGFIGLVNLQTYEVRILPVTAEPTRVRLSPDGSTALVLSDRAKVAWVIR
jgi:DNA-binding beta-propeller fold protein YncE